MKIVQVTFDRALRYVRKLYRAGERYRVIRATKLGQTRSFLVIDWDSVCIGYYIFYYFGGRLMCFMDTRACLVRTIEDILSKIDEQDYTKIFILFPPDVTIARLLMKLEYDIHLIFSGF